MAQHPKMTTLCRKSGPGESFGDFGNVPEMQEIGAVHDVKVDDPKKGASKSSEIRDQKYKKNKRNIVRTKRNKIKIH